jgi:hypothetical protein
MRAYSGEISGEISGRPSCYKARRIDQLKAESSIVFMMRIYTKECGCTSTSVHVVKLNYLPIGMWLYFYKCPCC